MRTRMRFAAVLSLVFLLTSCTSVVGAGVVAVVAGAAVLASDCSDYVDITVRDGVTGGRSCDAMVTVTREGDQERIMPCYHARLGEGTWQIRAALSGRADAVSTLVIPPRGECMHTVQTVELWLQPPGQAPETTPVRPSPAAPESAPLPPPPAAPSPAPPGAPPAPGAPPTPTAPPPPGPATGAPPKPPPPAPIQRFPDAVDGGK